ncbi:uncharacterized protein SCHCODRAFT_02620334 [Schizophyllum commune H4-8]|uniref:uncharacterized protein n=1 Tax=Schizophyllum commune (strain H4-8 / FGSC 9210) TaxID=578458 RepID=UPI0021600AD8|nr:uncharacterized protein SCHCODRAFT_02620334 [Schizophyllum commune H4-8]KAI5895786.1 hypothetical protein SCHCODRAFT_02620334 [Schizophyllum commune H4-8]
MPITTATSIHRGRIPCHRSPFPPPRESNLARLPSPYPIEQHPPEPQCWLNNCMRTSTYFRRLR